MFNKSLAANGNRELEKALGELFSYISDHALTTGNTYVVLPSATEPNYVDLFAKYQKVYSDGTEMIQATAQAAFDCTVTNRNDVIFLSANGTSNKVTEMLLVDHNRVHFIGLDPVNRKIGARSLLSNTGAGAATDVAMVKVTGTGCSFRNISFKNNWTVTENVSSVLDWGIQTYWENCDIEALGSAHLTNNAAASLKLGGNECIYKNCTIGQDTLLVTSTGGQQLLVTNRGSASTKSTRCRFENCLFQSYTSDTTHVFARFAATSVDRYISFDNCEFVNTVIGTSAVTLAVAIATDAGVAGSVNVAFPKVFGASNLATSAVGATGVFVASPVMAAAASDCVAVQSS